MIGTGRIPKKHSRKTRQEPSITYNDVLKNFNLHRSITMCFQIVSFVFNLKIKNSFNLIYSVSSPWTAILKLLYLITLLMICSL